MHKEKQDADCRIAGTRAGFYNVTDAAVHRIHAMPSRPSF
jgi:hypothetical protein